MIFHNPIIIIPVVSWTCLISGWPVWEMLANMFLCDRATPLDSPVVPLEYGIKTMSSVDQLQDFSMEVSTDGSIISLKSHVPFGLEPSRLTHTINFRLRTASLTSFWALITFGKRSGIVTMPMAPESFNWWAISSEIPRKKKSIYIMIPSCFDEYYKSGTMVLDTQTQIFDKKKCAICDFNIGLF